MASGWVKSLHCKSRAFEDVYHPTPSKILIPSASCRRSFQTIKEMVDIPKPMPRTKPMPKPMPRSRKNKNSLLEKHPSSRYPASTKPELDTALGPKASMNRSQSTAATSARPVTELPDGHPSRNVVEIIFHTSWGPKPFPGRVEVIFKIQNGARTVSRFEEFREGVKARAAACSAGLMGEEGSNWEKENARCVADGNEVMRFQCLGPTEDGAAAVWSFPERKGSTICTFSGSGGAHESAGGGKGRRAMLVCRVVAGRVSKQLGIADSGLEKRVGFDSVSGENGDLLVFDSRAVLPCFLIIYRL
ncbi:hypothetical protein HN51_062407 [Arachis hypogaea]|uniref:Uncharacterized protein n=2 Tax=Arachis hypogaea TaxID=3818 RepID=A0A445ASN1_ARAHY|nr:uncharacterized protein LOC107617913 [Arachis ipaensis]XP_025627831.1 uncharacterized protein LOC112720953 [Arachis hypogaea]QHO19877.1 uncharacterized protein DS421_11g332900 [Arachis hypogaea]RYR29442.1 hypothetical protein Ahy_B01g053818 isoform C [Arachis hypogaea]